MIYYPCFKMNGIKIRKWSALLILLLSRNFSTFSQTSPDAGLWTTATFECNLNSKFGLFITQEMRLKENFSRLNLLYTNLGLEYKFEKNFKTSLSYRQIHKFMPENYFSFRHRVQWDITFKNNVENFELSYRHRLQAEVRNVYSSDKGYLREWYSRNKLQIKYDLNKKYAPYFSVELRYQILNPRNPESNYVWHRIRYQTGIDHKINSHHSMGLYYLMQDEFNIIDPQNIYIIGIEYTYKL